MTRPCVLVIDAGLGNLGSVVAAFSRHNCDVIRLQSPPSSLLDPVFTHVVLPGVGSFNAGMKALTSKGWVHWIKSVWLDRQRPLLGICLGMQMLATYGYEGSSNGSPVSGLDLVPGHVDLLELPSGYLLPHVGWNSLCFTNTSHPLAQCLNEASDMYFVHSFVFNTRHPQHSIATTDYGSEFTSIVNAGSCLGVQFHPEKSQKFGKRIIKYFLATS